MKTIKNSIGIFVTKFLTTYLAGQKNMSSNTISSYAATFYLLFQFCRTSKKISAEKMTIESIDKELIIGFLDWLECARGVSISTRNQRLAAVRSFFRFVQYESPRHMAICQDILNIPIKKTVRPMISHLSHDELKAILRQPDITTAKGKRSIALLAVLYDSGARVSEIINLKFCDIRYDSPAMVVLTGKGGKTRYVPIMQETLSALKNYMSAYQIDVRSVPAGPVFFNSRGEKLTRAGITNIIARNVREARKECPSLPDTPLSYIRDILGHVSVLTTEIYIRINPELRRKYMEASHVDYQIPNANCQRWEENGELVEWLKKMCR